MTQKIIVSNLRIHGYHGVKDAEKSLGQKFHIDLVCDVDRSTDRRDDMDTTVCYGELCTLVEEVSSSETFNLIETLAERLAATIFERFNIVQRVELTIRKPSAPILHNVDYVAVSLVRTRSDHMNI